VGDEVIVPANSFVASSEAVTMAGARVVFVDCDAQTGAVDADDIRRKLTARTRAVMPVHLYGRPADLATIGDIARKANLAVVQDAAQAHGATLAGRPVAAFGDAACFSFFPGKNLGAYGDAGAIVTDDAALTARCRMLANHGREDKYDHLVEGVNSRMDGLQGAILDVKLRRLERWNDRRRVIAADYDRLLAGVGDLVLPLSAEDGRHVYHLYVIETARRDALQDFMKSHGISTGIHYPTALPLLGAYRHLGHRAQDFPAAASRQGRILSLPLYPEMTAAMVERVAETVNAFFSEN